MSDAVLSVIMPVYNERGTIREIVRRVMDLPVDKELIIVDDGSTDGTRDVLSSLSSANIKILFHDKNKGKGAAIRTGIAEAAGEFTVIQDADLEYDPNDYLSLLEPAFSGEANVVYGSRFRGEYSDFSTLHWWGNKFLTFAANLIYGSRLSDVETCYKLFRTSILRSIKLRAERFDFEPEVTAKLLRKGIRIAEVPISYTGRKFTEGKKITWRDGFSALRTLIKYRFVS
jgi:glycosyltransferase involved in cell wall biosynthesis